MVPLSTRGPSGIDLIETVKLALSDINSNDTILSQYELKAEIGFSKFNPASAIDVFIRMIMQKTIKVGIIGAQNSRSSEYVASAAKSWNLAQISHGSTSPILSNREQFPYFFRTALSDISYNLARVAFSLHYGWTKVAVLYQIATAYTAAANDLVSDFKSKNITDVYAEGVLDQFAVVIGNLKAKDMRIIYAIGQAPVILHVLCEAYKQKLYGPKYVWILVGWYPNDWWEVEMQPHTKCTPDQIYQVIQNYFYVYRSYPQTSTEPTISGRSPLNFNQQFQHLNNVTTTNTLRAYMYDAVWTMAHALDKTEQQLLPQNRSLSQFNYESSDIRSTIVKNIADMSILGITGEIKFFGADRLGDVYIFQFQGEKSQNKTVPVGLYKAATDSVTIFSENKVVWPNGFPPLSQSVIKIQTLHISLGLTIIYLALSILGILTSLLFFAFSLYYQNHKQIKLLSPRMNALFAIGCCICYVSVVMMAIDTNFTTTIGFSILCQANIWLLCLGFTLAFGSLFAKMWRVYRIFALKTAKRIIVKDWHLLAVVSQLAIVDIVLLTIWTVVDPLIADVITSTTTEPKHDIVFKQTSYVCTCKNTAVWLGLINLWRNPNHWGRRKIADQQEVFVDESLRGVGLVSSDTTFTTIESGRCALQNVIEKYYTYHHSLEVIILRVQ
ncbi:uncharacterized protein TRIADDRAFT_56611 [Trichoplax adhaerens]|uniref:Gamma-aminobutyric acid type B receptor subunit 2 n=1 Tax=Trichoplax adhaerens TaxID=10228 RepID=B3RYM7_TRIAD|nr:hypothetical protein TRIADDRAFT_56611 [Trichoplax adhaerens]EDV25068.1 hypothetical protein TRIADDRAFT_56611 [Trichoplax adhaerens]|eukprot:XP_002112958.1 hypothetical protein TRIADDRAFT_56611 [Trichoplax adhaerens]